MNDNVEKIDLNRVDWKSSREFFESLGEALNKLEDKDESYDFTWVGKRKSIIEAGAPIDKILRPDVEASKDFDNTKNMLIVGDNLDALKLLQESYLGKIKMIYIDPPYNTGHDFVYHDNFTVKKADFEDNSTDSDGNVIISGDEYAENSKANGRFHSDWLSMMYPRLKLARNLLTDDGVIFISIDDNESANLKKVCDEIFGEENFISNLKVEMSLTQGMKVGAAQNGTIVKNGELVVTYAKNAQNFKVCNLLYDGVGGYDKHFSICIKEDNDGKLSTYPIGEFLKESHKDIDVFFEKYNLSKTFSNFCTIIEKDDDFKSLIYKDYADKIHQSMMASVKITDDVKNRLSNGEVVKYDKYILHPTGNNGRFAQLSPLSATIGKTDDYFPSYGRRRIRGDMWKGFYSDMMNVAKEGDMDYKNGKKPVRLIEQLGKWGTNKSDIILDFFAGSGTTGHAVMDLNAEDSGKRQYICVQLDEKTDEKSEARKAGYDTIDQITAERLRRAGEKIKSEHPEADIDTGFRVFRVDGSNNNENIRKPLGEINQSDMFDMIDNVKKDRTPLDLLFGVIYTSALPFDLKLETRKIGENTVYTYGYLDENTGLIACFDDEVPEETVKEIAKLNPLTAAFKDSSFKNSAEKINLSEHFRIISPDTRVKVI